MDEAVNQKCYSFSSGSTNLTFDCTTVKTQKWYSWIQVVFRAHGKLPTNNS